MGKSVNNITLKKISAAARYFKIGDSITVGFTVEDAIKLCDYKLSPKTFLSKVNKNLYIPAYFKSGKIDSKVSIILLDGLKTISNSSSRALHENKLEAITKVVSIANSFLTVKAKPETEVIENPEQQLQGNPMKHLEERHEQATEIPASQVYMYDRMHKEISDMLYDNDYENGYNKMKWSRMYDEFDKIVRQTQEHFRCRNEWAQYNKDKPRSQHLTGINYIKNKTNLMPILHAVATTMFKK